MTPYEQSSRILDAASSGGRVPGYESVGDLLIDLGHVQPIEAGVALSSSAVAAASRVTAGSTLGLSAIVIKPIVVLLALGGIGAGVTLAGGSDKAPTLTGQDNPVEEVRFEDPSPLAPGIDRGSSVSAPSGPLPSAPAAVSQTSDGDGAAPTSPAAEGALTTPASPAQATTTTAATQIPTTTQPPATTSTTVAPDDGESSDPGSEQPENQGNNGNGNGKGVGNGKGNKGQQDVGQGSAEENSGG